jgi:hypothetical protein
VQGHNTTPNLLVEMVYCSYFCPGLLQIVILLIFASHVTEITDVHHHIWLLFFQTGFYCIAQAALELAPLLSLPLKCWDYRLLTPHQAFSNIFAPVG